MKLPFLVTVASYFRRNPPKGLPPKSGCRREAELRILVGTGRITLAQIQGNHPGKELHRLRKLGYVQPLSNPRGQKWLVNLKTGCQYKEYYWTGKLPPHWVKTPKYVGYDRRTTKRAR